jgi:hypothetical protein
MRTVDGASSTAYADMIQAHARAAAADRRGAAAEVATARTDRLAAAKRVLDAWTTFDNALMESPELARDPSVLLVFRMNDAQFARAKWFYDHHDTDALAPLLVATPDQIEDRPVGKPADRPAGKQDKSANLPRVATARERLAMAPPRLVWARRYQVLIDGPARALFELQEANRFAVLEAAAFGFERAMIAACVASPTGANATPGTCHGDPDALARAAQAAAALGLYVSDPKAQSPRIPLAGKLLHARAEGAAPAAAPSRKQPLAQSGGRDKQPSEEQEADKAMRGRGIRLL